MMRQLQQDPESVHPDLFALACGPANRVKNYSACVVDGVRFVTADREKDRKTQNSGVMSAGNHDKKEKDFYGVLADIIELSYNSDLKHKRTVVLFRCNWFRLAGLKSQDLEVYDNLFRSINISSYWYKDDNVILSTQATRFFT